MDTNINNNVLSISKMKFAISILVLAVIQYASYTSAFRAFIYHKPNFLSLRMAIKAKMAADPNYDPMKDPEAEDKEIVASGGISGGAFLEMSAQSRQAVINISAKLEDKGDSSVVMDLFQQNVLYVNEIIKLRKRNCDLITQITTSLPNYSKLKEELEVKFATYKSDLEKDQMSCEVQHAKTVAELKHQNSLLHRENEELKRMNKILIDKIDAMEAQMDKDRVQMDKDRGKIYAMEVQMDKDRVQMDKDRVQKDKDRVQMDKDRVQMDKDRVQKDKDRVQMDKDRGKIYAMEAQMDKLQTKLEDIEFQNFISDVFRFMRDGIIAKHSSTDFPNGVSALPLLKSPEDLLSDDEEDEDEEDTMTDEERTKSAQEKEAALTKAQDGHLRASTFIMSIGLDHTLVRDMYKLNKNRNDDTHDEDCKLFISKKVTSPKNVKALGEIRASLLKLHEGNAAFHVKDRLLQWVTSSLSAPTTTVPNAKTGIK